MLVRPFGRKTSLCRRNWRRANQFSHFTPPPHRANPSTKQLFFSWSIGPWGCLAVVVPLRLSSDSALTRQRLQSILLSGKVCAWREKTLRCLIELTIKSDIQRIKRLGLEPNTAARLINFLRFVSAHPRSVDEISTYYKPTTSTCSNATTL